MSNSEAIGIVILFGVLIALVIFFTWFSKKIGKDLNKELPPLQLSGAKESETPEEERLKYETNDVYSLILKTANNYYEALPFNLKHSCYNTCLEFQVKGRVFYISLEYRDESGRDITNNLIKALSLIEAGIRVSNMPQKFWVSNIYVNFFNLHIRKKMTIEEVVNEDAFVKFLQECEENTSEKLN